MRSCEPSLILFIPALDMVRLHEIAVEVSSGWSRSTHPVHIRLSMQSILKAVHKYATYQEPKDAPEGCWGYGMQEVVVEVKVWRVVGV
jgi:hypothetical protein